MEVVLSRKAGSSRHRQRRSIRARMHVARSRLKFEGLEPRNMLAGDTGDSVSNDWTSFVPGGFSESDVAQFDTMIGGEQLVMLPDSIQNVVPDENYSFQNEFSSLVNYSIHDDVTISGTSFAASQTEAQDGVYYATLKRLDYTLVVDNDLITTDTYRESFDVTRRSWVWRVRCY